ncbi:Lcl C-terminal domain-containing protein [Salinimonas chungwhensis]|uniref:Lcl C-terminal domain-containing protein n=1 Tax=Salinimonas chungwhensis TaxID=265425 RepID=UPI0003778A29|nr:DUF1566 domain-containing protein [Salinimonas chungwhensis]
MFSKWSCNKDKCINISLWKTAVFLTAGILLAGCGGGSDSSSSSAPVQAALLVNAGADIQADEQTTVTVSAQTEDTEQTLVYSWSAAPQLIITQEDNTVGDATVTLPVLKEQTTYTLTVEVTAEDGARGTDSLVITGMPDNNLPNAVIDVSPAADDNGQYAAGVSLTLDGSASTDADAEDQQNPISAWQWEQTEGVDVTGGSELDKPQLNIVTPISSSQQNLTFTLTVTDDEDATHTATINLIVKADSDTAPTISAGYNQGVFSGEPIVLEGTADSTVPSAFPLTYAWESSGLDGLSIDNPEALSTFVIAPEVDSETSATIILNVTDANGNVASDTINIKVRAMAPAKLNDTGVTAQATTDVVVQTQQNEYAGQDGQRGGDIIAKAGMLEKAGQGTAGFDFTKVNGNGDEQDDDATAWSCVRDNTTGLVWEVKTTSGGLHDTQNTYGWYQEENNGGVNGTLNPATASCSLTNCNTNAFISAANSEGLCGFYDWRLPTHQELMSLLHFGKDGEPMVDDQYFPNTGNMTEAPLWYWTSRPGADGVINNAAQNSVAIDFASGVDNFLKKDRAVRVRLVRAGRN